MGKIIVTDYSFLWFFNKKLGKVVLLGKPDGSKLTELINYETNDPAEYMALIDVLRNEKPIFYDPDQNCLFGSYEEPGEEE
jgi:hypothetical protein